MRLVKICAVTMRYPPTSMVGAWITTHEFLADMVRRGHEVTALTTLARITHTLDGVVVKPRDPNGRDLRAADVIISHLGDDGRTARDAERFGIPSVRMVHGSNPSNAERIARYRTALVVFNSHSTLAEVGDVDVPAVVCHPPVDPARYRTTPGDLVTLVNIAPEKGGVTLALTAASMPDVDFLAVRGGYLSQHVRMPANVETIATVSDMAAEVYSRTRILLMPSERETWGRVGVEAMASGIPVIAHPTPGLVESLGDAGIFVDRTDRAGWIREIRRLSDPGEWAAASAAALARSVELDPADDFDRFAHAVEQLVGVPA